MYETKDPSGVCQYCRRSGADVPGNVDGLPCMEPIHGRKRIRQAIREFKQGALEASRKGK